MVTEVQYINVSARYLTLNIERTTSSSPPHRCPCAPTEPRRRGLRPSEPGQLPTLPRRVRARRALLRAVPDAVAGAARHGGRGQDVPLSRIRAILPGKLQRGHQVGVLIGMPT